MQTKTKLLTPEALFLSGIFQIPDKNKLLIAFLTRPRASGQKFNGQIRPQVFGEMFMCCCNGFAAPLGKQGPSLTGKRSITVQIARLPN